MLIKRVLVGLLFVVGFSAAQASEWKLETTDDAMGINVYTRDIAGSAFKEYKGVTELSSTLSGVVALMKDSENLPNWIHNMVEQKLLKRKAGKSLSYSVTRARGTEPRDNIVMSNYKQDPDTNIITISIKGKPKHLPVKEGYIRVPLVNGSWVFAPKGNGKVEITYQLHVEPGGDLSPKMYNEVGAIDAPLGTLSGMHKQIAKYQDQKLEFVSE